MNVDINRLIIQVNPLPCSIYWKKNPKNRAPPPPSKRVSLLNMYMKHVMTGLLILHQKTLSAFIPGHPNLYNICFLPLPFFFIPAPSASPSTAFSTSLLAWLLAAPAPPLQGLTALLPIPRPPSHRTLLFVRPAIRVFGFAVAGKAGNDSEAIDLAEEEELGGALEVRPEDGRGLDDAEDVEGVIQGVGPTRPAPARLAETEMVGNGSALAALPQLLCLLTADREDCAVEDFNLSTR